MDTSLDTNWVDTNKKGHIQTATPRFFLVNTLSPAWLSPSSGRIWLLFYWSKMVEKTVENWIIFFTSSMLARLRRISSSPCGCISSQNTVFHAPKVVGASRFFAGRMVVENMIIWPVRARAVLLNRLWFFPRHIRAKILWQSLRAPAREGLEFRLTVKNCS